MGKLMEDADCLSKGFVQCPVAVNCSLFLMAIKLHEEGFMAVFNSRRFLLLVRCRKL
jgi:hypothetical protein